MRTLKMLWLMVVCFYYGVLTPGSVSTNRGEEQFLWGAISVSIFQALIAMGLFYFFDWPSQLLGVGRDPNSLFIGMLVFGGIAGIWTFVGAAMHPSLQKMINENEEVTRLEKRNKELDQKAFYRRRCEEDRALFKALSRKNPKKAYKEAKKASKLLKNGKKDKIKFYNLRNSVEVLDEINRLENLTYH